MRKIDHFGSHFQLNIDILKSFLDLGASLSNIYHFGVYFQLAVYSKGYEPDILTDKVFVWTPSHSCWKIISFATHS